MSGKLCIYSALSLSLICFIIDLPDSKTFCSQTLLDMQAGPVHDCLHINQKYLNAGF